MSLGVPESSVELGEPARRVELDVKALQLQSGVDGHPMKSRLSTYEKNGISEFRVAALLKSGACKCNRRCHTLVDKGKLHEVLRWWHGHLHESDRVFLLSTLYSEQPRERARTQWVLSGVEVCRTALYTLMGMANNTMSRHCRGIPDGRKFVPKGSTQAMRVHQFLLELHMSAAEPMPHEHYMVKGGVDGNIECDENPWEHRTADPDDYSAGAVESDGDTMTEAWNPDRSVPSTITAFLGKDVGVPRRWLQQTCMQHLYLLFIASCGEDASSCPSVSHDDCVSSGVPESTLPSWSTFQRVWASTWPKYLKFRQTSQHAECKTCFEARQRIQARSLSLVQRVEYARQWRAHLKDHYYDRAIYWFCRYASRHNLNVLTIIIDSMDKAKFAWPQFPWHRVDKTLEDFVRPRLCFTAAIAHGYGIFFYIADELSHGDLLSAMSWSVSSRRSGKCAGAPESNSLSTWLSKVTTPLPKPRTT